MKLSLLLIALLSFSVSYANVNDKTASTTSDVQNDLDTTNVKAELINELNEAPEDLEFDADDQLSNDSNFEDAEIERIAQAEKEEAAAKDSKSTKTRK